MWRHGPLCFTAELSDRVFAALRCSSCRTRAVQALHEADPATVPHTLPNEYGVMDLIANLPLRLVRYVDLPDLYYAVLQARRDLSPHMWPRPLVSLRCNLPGSCAAQDCARQKHGMMIRHGDSYSRHLSVSGRMRQ